MRVALLALGFGLLAACSAETDQSLYVAGEAGTATFSNRSRAVTAYLPGCAPFTLERSLSGKWTEIGPPWVCVWEGIAVAVGPRSSLETPFTAPSASGRYRLRYDVSLGCNPGLPLSQADCKRQQAVPTDPFEVERELCDPAEQGCQFVPLAPNFLCDDGVSVGGPAGVCTRDPASGQCGYEFLSCP